MTAITPVQTKDTDKATPLQTQANFDRKQYSKEYYEKNKDKILQYRHVLMQLRHGTPEERADADRRRNSSNRNYGTGSTSQGAAAARAVSK
jgi:hypothetical protein